MKPVTVSVVVPNAREQVYRHLDVLANHEEFTDHMLVDWQCSGPRSGVGARARMRLKKPGRPDWMELEVAWLRIPRLERLAGPSPARSCAAATGARCSGSPPS